MWGQYKGYDIIRITVDGKIVKPTDAPAIKFDGRTMVPVYMLQQAGVKYIWDDKNKTVAITKPAAPAAAFDPVKTMSEITSLGGSGVTLSVLKGENTANVYFEQNKGFNDDIPNMQKIFNKLVQYKATYSRITYVVNGNPSGVIEIRTTYYQQFLNGTLNSDELNKHWMYSGPLFSNSNSGTGSTTPITTDTPEIYSNDLKKYLGKLTSNEYDSDSLFNEYGTYGSKYAADSIWNEYGTYGSDYSNESVFNKYATKPPAIVLNNKIIGYLTTNTTVANAVSPLSLLAWLEKNGY